MNNRCLVLVLLIITTGCVSYERDPLVPENVFNEVEQIRQSTFKQTSSALTFSTVRDLMDKHSPQLDQIRSKYKTAQRIAEIKTPWFNPSIEVGADLGSHLESGASGKTRPFVGLGFTIPLGGKLSKNDDVNQAKANRAFIEVQAQHRELYLDLRKQYTSLYLIDRKLHLQKSLVDSSQSMLRLTRTLMDAGSATELDVGMIELDSNKEELRLIEIENEKQELCSQLSILLGIDADTLGDVVNVSLPSVDQKIPAFDHLKKQLVNNHLALARLRFDYEVAEKELILEISKQYPDFHFGADRSKEVGEDTVILGLRLGIDIPLFDQNQQGIARAKQKRREVRKKYIAEVHYALSELNKSYENIKLNRQKERLLTDVIKPRAEGNLKIAQQALESGSIDALKYLDVLRTYQRTMQEVALIESDVRLAWIDLEKVLGFPLISYPGEGEFSISLDPKKTDQKEILNEQ